MYGLSKSPMIKHDSLDKGSDKVSDKGAIGRFWDKLYVRSASLSSRSKEPRESL